MDQQPTIYDLYYLTLFEAEDHFAGQPGKFYGELHGYQY
jgi:hypothetical protein